MNKPPSFIEFGTPSTGINAYSWKDRLRALQDGYPNRWAKYGAFTSKKSAQNAASRIRTMAKQNKFKVEMHIEGNERREYFLWIKVVVDAI